MISIIYSTIRLLRPSNNYPCSPHLLITHLHLVKTRNRMIFILNFCFIRNHQLIIIHYIHLRDHHHYLYLLARHYLPIRIILQLRILILLNTMKMSLYHQHMYQVDLLRRDTMYWTRPNEYEQNQHLICHMNLFLYFSRIWFAWRPVRNEIVSSNLTFVNHLTSIYFVLVNIFHLRIQPCMKILRLYVSINSICRKLYKKNSV